MTIQRKVIPLQECHHGTVAIPTIRTDLRFATVQRVFSGNLRRQKTLEARFEKRGLKAVLDW
jgi:hypothetical protein